MPGVGERAGLAPPGAGLRWLFGAGKQLQCLSTTDFAELASAPSDPPVPFTDQLRLAMLADLARWKARRYRPFLPCGPRQASVSWLHGFGTRPGGMVGMVVLAVARCGRRDQFVSLFCSAGAQSADPSRLALCE
jgi:hypothetical protein